MSHTLRKVASDTRKRKLYHGFTVNMGIQVDTLFYFSGAIALWVSENLCGSPFRPPEHLR